jgi:hypothetical protein
VVAFLAAQSLPCFVETARIVAATVRNMQRRSRGEIFRAKKVGLDLETVVQTQRLLGHADSRVTKKHHRRRTEIVRQVKPKVS